MKTILFDLYGTLVDIYTNESSFLFWCKFSKSTREYKKYTPLKLKKTYLSICQKLSKEREEIDILDVFKILFDVDDKKAKTIALLFRKLSRKKLSVYPMVKETLELLKKEYDLYLVSNAQAAFTQEELDTLGLTSYFKGIALSSSYGIKKPNPLFFQRVIKDYHIQGEIYMIGNDYECDIKPCKDLGIKAIFIASNLTFKNQQYKDLSIQDFAQIIPIINA